MCAVFDTGDACESGCESKFKNKYGKATMAESVQADYNDGETDQEQKIV